MAYPVDQRFLQALRGPTVRWAAEVNLLSDGVPVDGWQDLPVEQIQVTCARSNAQRTSCSVLLTPTLDDVGNLLGDTIAPTDISSPLAPNGNELQVSAGVTYDDGTVVLVPVGTFPIETVTTVDTNQDLTIQVDCVDRSKPISARSLDAPYTVTAGQTIDQALMELLQAHTTGLPSFRYNIMPSTSTAPGLSYQPGQDPWQAAQDLAATAGYELYFDRYGNLSGRAIPDPSSTKVFVDISELVEGAGPLMLTRKLTIDGFFNDFIVSASNSSTSTPVQAEASDTNPDSPTYISGKLGRRLAPTTSQTATTVGACQDEANLDLAASLGQIDTMTLETLCNPAIDIDDVVTVTRKRAGINGLKYVVDGYSMTIAIGGTMSLQLRKVLP